MGAPQQQAKILRIGIIQGGKITEERLIGRGETVTIGEADKNTFVLPTASLPKSYPLFVANGQGYYLSFNPEIKGKISVGGAVMELDSLSQRKETKQDKGNYMFPLTEDMRGKVSVSDVSILFQFVPPPVSPAAGVLDTDFYLSWHRRVDWVFSGIFVAMLVAHFAFILFVRSLPPPPEPTFQEIDDKFVRILKREEPKPVPVETIATEPEPGEGEQKAEPDESKSKGKDDSQANDQPRSKEQIRESVKKQGFLAVIGGKGTKPGLSTGITDLMEGTGGNLDEFVKSDASLAKTGTGGLKQADAGFGHAPVGGGDGPVVGVEQVAVSKVAKAKPKASIDRPVDVVGALDSAKIASTLVKYKSALDACHTKALNINPQVSGRLELQITLEPSGKVVDVAVKQNSTNSRDLERCVLSRARLWTFPAFEGGLTQFNVPLIFSAAG